MYMFEKRRKKEAQPAEFIEKTTSYRTNCNLDSVEWNGAMRLEIGTARQAPDTALAVLPCVRLDDGSWPRAFPEWDEGTRGSCSKMDPMGSARRFMRLHVARFARGLL